MNKFHFIRKGNFSRCLVTYHTVAPAQSSKLVVKRSLPKLLLVQDFLNVL